MSDSLFCRHDDPVPGCEGCALARQLRSRAFDIVGLALGSTEAGGRAIAALAFDPDAPGVIGALVGLAVALVRDTAREVGADPQDLLAEIRD